MAFTPHTKDEDARLRKELEHADVKKFKMVIKKGFRSSSKPKYKKK